MDEMAKQLNAWREALKDAKKQASEPVAEQAPPEPPAEKIEFSINSTHVPEKCPRQSVAGATMKVHYVGKLLEPGGKPGKIFASSFHTGSMPFKFTLGSDDVVEGWNKGLGGMCEGERRRLTVPWTMGFGAKGDKGVPPYSDLQARARHTRIRSSPHHVTTSTSTSTAYSPTV